MLNAFQLSEPLIEAVVSLLTTNLNTTIDQLNASNTDQFNVPHAAQILDFVPVPSTLEGGMPAIGVQELGAEFENDLVTTTDAQHNYAIVAILNHTDQQTLAIQLRRMMQAIAFTLQADRQAGTAQGGGGIIRTEGGAWSINLVRYDPGPLLGDLDPTNPEAPPRAYLSWVALTCQSMRAEV